MSSRWTFLAVVAVGVLVLVLSFVPGWLTQERVLLGEGPRTLLSYPFAWQGEALPVVAAGVACIVAAAALAVRTVAADTPATRFAVLGLLAVGAGVLAGSLWPVAQSGHASSVSLAPGWPLMVATALALLALGVTVPAGRLGPVLIGGLVVMVLVAGVGSALGRQAWLHLQEDSTQHYAQGRYTRTATGGEPTETLTLSSSTFQVARRWSGSYEPDGLVIVFIGDPACPTARGSYHAHAAGTDADIRLEAIVDVCRNGERKKDLQTGIWVRDR